MQYLCQILQSQFISDSIDYTCNRTWSVKRQQEEIRWKTTSAALDFLTHVLPWRHLVLWNVWPVWTDNWLQSSCELHWKTNKKTNNSHKHVLCVHLHLSTSSNSLLNYSIMTYEILTSFNLYAWSTIKD